MGVRSSQQALNQIADVISDISNANIATVSRLDETINTHEVSARNEVVYQGIATWTENSNTAKTIDIPIPDSSISSGEKFLVSIKNESATVDIGVVIGNRIIFNGNEEFVPLIASQTVAKTSDASSTAPQGGLFSYVVDGFLLGEGGRVFLSKLVTSVAPAFSVSIEIRRI